MDIHTIGLAGIGLLVTSPTFSLTSTTLIANKVKSGKTSERILLAGYAFSCAGFLFGAGMVGAAASMKPANCIQAGVKTSCNF